MTTLESFLMGSLAGAVPLGALIAAALEYLVGDEFHALSMKEKRLALALLTTIAAGTIYGVAIALGYVPAPTSARELAESIWSAVVPQAAMAFTSATITHAGLVDYE